MSIERKLEVLNKTREYWKTFSTNVDNLLEGNNNEQ